MKTKNKFPLYLQGLSNEKNNNVAIIVVDLQEKKSRVGLFVTENQSAILKNEATYDTQGFENFSQIVNTFIKEHDLKNVSRLSVSVPGPVIADKGFSDRLPWSLDSGEIKRETNIESVFLINDLEASAYGLADLSEDCLIPLYEPEEPTKGNVALMSPGNGLGEAGLFYDGECLRPFATEGGHSEFSPRTNVEVEFYQFLNQIYGIVSWESVLSKSGMFNIFRFLRDDKRHPQSEKFLEKLRQGEFTKMLYEAATQDAEQIATITINTYLEFLAREANNLTLKLKATGGLLIGGEIPRLLKDYIDKDRFYQKFKISDKMEMLLKQIPIYLVASDKTSFYGAAYYAAFSEH